MSVDPFDAFWYAYPRKAAKKTARTTWTRLMEKTSPEVIMDALDAQKAAWREEKRDLEHTPYPATWLNATDFDDEFEARADDKEVPQLFESKHAHRCQMCAADHYWICNDNLCFIPKEPLACEKWRVRR